LEENTSGPSPGRVDQYLYPFFERDLASGVLDRSAAQELLLCFLLKFNEIPWLLSESGARYFAGYMPFMNICVGGQTPNGRDASNELSYLLLDCVRRLRMYQPSLAARVHNASPPEFLRAIAEVVRAGLGFPALHFDDPTIKMLLAEGIPVEDARDYCIMGCVEPYVHGKMARWSSAVYTNFPIAIEFALTDGRHRATDQILGARTGDPRSFASFEDFLDAVRQQLRHILDASATATVVAQAAHRLHLPKPVSSALVIGCLESGRDITAGGAHYNCGPGVICVGLADHANSLAAIKHLVYDTGAVSMAELCAALDADFQGYSVLHKKCLDAPKYGNDDDTVDLLAVEALDFMAAELGRRRGLYAKLELGTLSVTTNIPQGLAIGALPSGRKAAEPLADGISPVAGSDRLGPTAAIKSVDKLNQEVSTVGTLFNMKLDPRLLADDLGVANFIALIRTHNQLGGAQIQFNCVSAADLLDAQQHPEKHRHLIVRVSG
ncbi:MAG: formate C-acetyltransferase/glycerol dehydratase family glycyl radical enzyme, partial [Cyanobacteria bacterium NC_groundwater_1444_Ag_S-0.65um_54_12]|nr:formate C-acetyltransferase/glycerol dehydratase family glycyl radical enzyme [Cyanobacteria bacterium NC_groundwater_1444_Ag_S-0.65um_54_12]